MSGKFPTAQFIVQENGERGISVRKGGDLVFDHSGVSPEVVDVP